MLATLLARKPKGRWSSIALPSDQAKLLLG